MTAKILLTALLIACTPSSSTTAPPDMPAGAVWLCEVESGQWCQSPRTVQTPPMEASGSLCCWNGVCVKWGGGACSGDLGWCADFTTAEDPVTGIVEATCHD